MFEIQSSKLAEQKGNAQERESLDAGKTTRPPDNALRIERVSPTRR
jgi:hypothetical protein